MDDNEDDGEDDGEDDEDISEEENDFDEPHMVLKEDKLVKELMIVKKRQWALESTIKNENKRQLVDLMKVMGKDKV